jgi:PQ loop repeat
LKLKIKKSVLLEMRIRKQQQHPVAVVGSRAVGGGVMERTAATAGIVMEQQQEDPSPVEPPPSTATPLLSDHDNIFVPRGGGEPLLASSAPLESSSSAEEVLLSNGGGDGDGSSRSSFRRLLYLLTSPLTDDQGRQPLAIVMGLLSMALGGIILGMLLPKSDSLPSQVPWLPAFISYRTVSSCIGYTYFLSWSTSFYPQLVANFRRKTTAGLSADFCVLNVLGFSWYVKNSIRKTHKEKNET